MRLFRVDRVDASLSEPVEGSAGAMLVEGFAARPGIYEYMNEDGSIRRELVPRDRLWNTDSMLTLCRAPLTLNHPPVMVTDANVNDYMVGDVGEEVIEGPGGFVRVRLAVRTQEAKDALRSGKVELSPGYMVEIDATPGEDPEFGHYDAIQVSRSYNHLAIVDAARGGPACRIKMDGVDEIAVMVKERPMNPKVLAAWKARSQADGWRPILTVDTLAEHMNTQKALGDFWSTFWSTYDALCASMSEALDQEDAADKLAGIADELVQVVTDAASKFKETITSATAQPAQAPTEPAMDEAPAWFAAFQTAIEAKFDALDAKVQPPPAEPKTDGVDADRAAWYKQRRTIETKADAAGVTFDHDAETAKIAQAVAAAYGIVVDGLDDKSVIAIVASLPAGSFKPVVALDDTPPVPAKPATQYGKG